MNNNSTSTVPFQGGEYTGPLNDQGLPHGKGSLYFPYTKHKYEGEFVNGQAHGKGVASGVLSQEMTLIVNNELRNVGDKFVSCSSSNSSGTSSSSTTNSSSSSSSNLIDSNNNNTLTSQWKYDGQWMNGQMHGQGEFTFANGDMYSGEWKDGVACGKGLYSWQSTGDRYMGEFVNMKRHGAGTMLFSNGHKYDGLFYNDYRHGHGIETYSNGNRFEGYWVMDKRHGPAFAYVKFENLDKKLQKKRKQGMKGQPTIPSSQVTNQANSKTSTIYLNLHSIDQYVVYSQEYHLGRLLSEKELFPCDYAPYIYTGSSSGGVSGGGLKAPTELLTQDMDSVLVQIDEEIETLVMESNSSGGSSSGYSSSGGNGSVHHHDVHHSNHHTPTITSDTIVSDDDDKNSSPTIHTSGGGMSNNTTTSSNMNSPPTAMTTITSSQILNKLAKRKSQSATLNQQSSSPPIHGHLIGTNLMTSPPSPSSNSHSTQVLSSSASTSSQSILTTDNVFVQGVVCWEDKYWDMIQQLFVQQFTSKCEYNYTKILLNTLDQVTTLEERRQQLMEHIDKCENAKSKTKWEMKRVIVEELHAEAPNDYSGVDLFMDRLDELMSEMRIELSDIIEMKNSASQVRDEKKIQLTKQQLSEIEKKLFRLESALQTAKNTAQPFTKIKLFMRDQVLYQQLLEEVAIHLQRLRVLLRRLMLIRYDVHNISVNVDSNSTTVTLNKEQLEAMADIKLHVQLVQGLFESSVMRSRAAAALVGVSEKNAQNSLTLDTNAVIDHVLKRTRQLSEHILSQ